MNKTIHTYEELQRWVDAYLKVDGLKLLFVVGDPGTAKSNTFKERLDAEQHHYIHAARLTAFQLFKQLYLVRNKALILDDVDDALKSSDTARLLMALCETDDAARKVGWFGSESRLKVDTGKKVVAIPQEFDTTSRVCIICNDWKILNRKFGALLDRGTVIFFDPDAAELHRFAGEWFRDEEIYGFIGEHLFEIARHSMRYYVNAADLKKHGLDWRAALHESWSNGSAGDNATENLVRRLLADEDFKDDKGRIEAFTTHSGASRRTWFYIKKRLGATKARATKPRI